MHGDIPPAARRASTGALTRHEGDLAAVFSGLSGLSGRYYCCCNFTVSYRGSSMTGIIAWVVWGSIRTEAGKHGFCRWLCCYLQEGILLKHEFNL